MEVETHRVVRGRRWRVSDPRIPEQLRQALVDELMAARRAVRDADDGEAERAARGRVHDAKVALGERGVAWWLAAPSADERADRVAHAARALRRSGLAADARLGELVGLVTSEDDGAVAAVLRR